MLRQRTSAQRRRIGWHRLVASWVCLCLAAMPGPAARAASRVTVRDANGDGVADLVVDSAPALLGNGRLIQAERLLGRFADAKSKVGVIVVLEQPIATVRSMDWKSGADRARLQGLTNRLETEVLDTLSADEFVLARRYGNFAAFAGRVSVEGLQKLINDPSVQAVQADLAVRKSLRQGIPLIKADAYRAAYQGQGVSIGIVDDGVDYTHPMLGGGSFPNAKVIGGYDFITTATAPRSDENPHGTAVAGIAAGNLGEIGDYIGGVAPAAKIYALKVFGNGAEEASFSTVIEAWDWAVTHQYDDAANPLLVLNNSIGGGYFQGACDGDNPALAIAANAANLAGITVLAASGNDGYCDAISAPACLSNVISVGAVYDASIGSYSWCVDALSCAEKTIGPSGSCSYVASQTAAADEVTVYSNSALQLQVLAPSNNATTTDLVGAAGYSTGNYVLDFGGTSAATPYASGAVAVLQSAAKDMLGRFLTPDEVRGRLIFTGDQLADSKNALSRPRIDVKAALDSLASGVSLHDYFTELFASSNNDLSGLSLHFTAGHPVNGYTLCTRTASGLRTDPSTGTPLTLGEDGWVRVDLSGGASVPLYGVSYSSFFINSNGSITFNAGDATASPTLAAHFSQPRISALFDDLSPAAGQVTWQQFGNRVVVTYSGVSEKGTSDSNTFQVEMFFDGRIWITYAHLDATGGLAGLSQGFGVISDFEGSNLSAYDACASNQPPVLEILGDLTVRQGESATALVATATDADEGSANLMIETGPTTAGLALATVLNQGEVTATAEASADFAPGWYPVALTVTDSDGAASTGTFSIHVVTAGARDYYTQLFDADSFDLGYQTLVFTPDDSPSSYSLCRTAAAAYPTPLTGANVLALDDDGWADVTLSGGATFPLYGQLYSTLFVNSNGTITFGSGDTAAVESLANHFSQPRVSVLFDDFDPSAATGSGEVSWRQLGDRVAITWNWVAKRVSQDLMLFASFQAEFFFDGTIRLTYLDVQTGEGLAGLSAGGGVPADYAPSDLSAANVCPFTISGARNWVLYP